MMNDVRMWESKQSRRTVPRIKRCTVWRARPPTNREFLACPVEFAVGNSFLPVGGLRAARQVQFHGLTEPLNDLMEIGSAELSRTGTNSLPVGAGRGYLGRGVGTVTSARH